MDANGVVEEENDRGIIMEKKRYCGIVYQYGVKLCIDMGGACFGAYLIIMALEDLKQQNFNPKDDHDDQKHLQKWYWTFPINFLSAILFFILFICNLVSTFKPIFKHFFAPQKIEPDDLDNNVIADHHQEDVV